jgi:xanthosine utilization system XapX-like protein
VRVTLRAVKLHRSVGGAVAGGLAATVWAAQQPLDKRLFDSDYDDVELLGKLVTRGDGWPAAGLALHALDGALFGAVYSLLRPFVPAPPVAAGLLAGLVEHFAFWPLAGVLDRVHPARRELVSLGGNRRAFAQAAWRHAVFGLVLGGLEALINDRSADEPPPIPFSSNGHGSLEAAVSVAEA